MNGNEPDLVPFNKSACREVAQNQDEKFYNRTTKPELDKLSAKIKALEKEVDELRALCEPCECEPEEPLQFPDEVYDVKTLEQFINVAFGEGFLDKYFPIKKDACVQVRDALAMRYSDIERINDQQERHNYTAPDDKHRDAIYKRTSNIPTDALNPGAAYTWMIIDFCLGSTEPGTLRDSLIWKIIEDTPW